MADPTLQHIHARVATLEGQLARNEHRRRRARRALPLLAVALLSLLTPLGLLAANPFTDLNPGSVHNANIDAIYTAGVTTGCVPDQEYCPNANVTREEMASFLARLGGLGSNPPVAHAKTAETADTATLANGVPAGTITPAMLSGTGATAGQVLTATGTGVAFQTPPANGPGTLATTIKTGTDNVLGGGGEQGDVTLTCDAGTRIVGGGWSAPSGPPPTATFTVLQNYPSSETAWTVRVFNTSGTAFTLTAYAICAAITGP